AVRLAVQAYRAAQEGRAQRSGKCAASASSHCREQARRATADPGADGDGLEQAGRLQALSSSLTSLGCNPGACHGAPGLHPGYKNAANPLQGSRRFSLRLDILLGQVLHAFFQALQGQRVHAVFDQFAYQTGGSGVVPGVLGVGVDPDDLLEFLGEALHPDVAGFLVPVLDAAAGLGDFVGRHGRIADKHHLVVGAVLVQQVQRRGAFAGAAHVVLPHAFVDEVVEVEILQMLELGFAGTEQFLADLDVGVHRTADVQQQQELDRVASLRAHLDIAQTAVLRGVVDGAVEIALFGRAFTCELAQATQGDLDVARAQLDLIVEVLVFALIPHLGGLALALAGIADANAFRVVAAGTERAGTAGTDPLVAAGVLFLLLLEAFLELLDQLVQTTEALDLRFFLFAQQAFEFLAQPFLGDHRLDMFVEVFQTLEVGTEGPVELVEVTFVLHQNRARQVIEL